MKERPILFSGEMVRSILDERKTQTRRVIKPQPPEKLKWMGWIIGVGSSRDISLGCAQWVDEYPLSSQTHTVRCPYGRAGDRLWVRESYAPDYYYSDNPDSNLTAYKATWSIGIHNFMEPKWRPSIFMPRRESRIMLEITAVRVQRLHEMTEAECIAEGVTSTQGMLHPNFYAFNTLWNQLNAKRGYGWEINPWVWVIEFKRVKP